jgi:hypothetical protein
MSKIVQNTAALRHHLLQNQMINHLVIEPQMNRLTHILYIIHNIIISLQMMKKELVKLTYCFPNVFTPLFSI